MKIIDIVPLCDREECVNKYNGTFHFLPDYIPANEYTVCEYQFEKNGYKNEYQCAERAVIYFDGDFSDNFKIGKGYYNSISDGENTFDFSIEEIDTDENCIVVFKGGQDYSKLDIVHCKIAVEFDKDKLPDFEKLYEFGFDSFPSFHESHISYLEIVDKNIKFAVEGSPFNPLKTTFEMSGITDIRTQSTDTDDLFSYFQKLYRIGEVSIYTLESGYKVIVEDNFNSGSFDENGDMVEVSHTNMIEIFCEDLKLDFEKVK